MMECLIKREIYSDSATLSRRINRKCGTAWSWDDGLSEYDTHNSKQ